MSRWSALLRGWGYLLALLYLLLLTAGALASRFGAIGPEELLAFLQSRRGVLTLYILAAGALLGAIYCLIRLVGLYQSPRRLIKHQSPRGLIQIAPLAIRDFARQVLEKELGLTRCRVRLDQSAQGGLRLRVRAHLPASDNLMELGERIQRHLKGRVEEQIGISVDEVTVFAPRIGAAGPPGAEPPAQAQATAQSYINLSEATELQTKEHQEQEHEEEARD